VKHIYLVLKKNAYLGLLEECSDSNPVSDNIYNSYTV